MTRTPAFRKFLRTITSAKKDALPAGVTRIRDERDLPSHSGNAGIVSRDFLRSLVHADQYERLKIVTGLLDNMQAERLPAVLVDASRDVLFKLALQGLDTMDEH